MATPIHYKFPVYRDVTDRINLNLYRIHQPLLIMDDPNGNFEIYIVLDNTQGYVTIQSAIDNEYITPLLSTTGKITDVTYDELYTDAKDGNLVPGTWYRILDYHSVNTIAENDSTLYTSPDTPIIVFASNYDKVSSLGVDPTYVNDVISYDIYPLISASGYRIYDPVGDAIVDEDYFSDDPFFSFYGPTADDKFAITFLSDQQVYLGTETKPLYDDESRVIVTCYDSSSGYSAVSTNLADPNVSWDNTTKILTLSGNYTFKTSDSPGYYMYSLTPGWGYYTQELERGRIYYRKDMKRNIEADFDWRNVKFALYNTTCSISSYQFENGVTSGYYKIRPGSITYYSEPNDYVITGNSADYILQQPFSDGESVKNISSFLSKYIIIDCDNVNGIELKSTISVFIKANYTRNLKILNSNVIHLIRYGIDSVDIISSMSIRTGQAQELSNSTLHTLNTCLMNCRIKYVDTIGGNIGHLTFPSSSSRLEKIKLINGSDLFNIFDINSSNSRLNNVIFDSCTVFLLHLDSANISNTTFKGSITTQFFGGSEVPNTFSSTIDDFEFSGEITSSSFVNDISNTKFKGELYHLDVPAMQNSDLFGNLRELTIPETIITNSIDINSDKVLYPLSLTINCDTSSNPINLELPGNPSEGHDIVIIDVSGNASTNNITISISSSPDAGVINTINGGTGNVVIDLDYGIMELRYSSSSGWIKVRESIVSDQADEVTIHKQGNTFSIYDIDYIIDSDQESIDSSNTPMSDGNHEIVTRAYVDSLTITGNVMATSNIDINNPPSSIDGVSLNNGDIIVAFDQTTSTEDGVYVYNGAGNPLTRHPDYPVGKNILAYFIRIINGDASGDTAYMVRNNDSAILGTDDIDYVGIGGAAVTQWMKSANPTGFGQQLTPVDPQVKRMAITNTDRGFNEIYLENANTTDNYTGASITLTVDSANYTNQTFISHHGPNYYQSHLRNRGAIMTDSSMYIGAYNSTDQQGQPAFVAFIVGDDYYNQKEIFRLTTDGLEMPLDTKKFWYQAGTIVQNHPGNDYTQLFVNKTTSEVYAGVPSQLGSVRAIEITNNLSLSGSATVDGIVLNDGDRVAVFAQTDATQNGIYIVDTSGAWSRAGDMDTGLSVGGKIFYVNEGGTNGDTLWAITNNAGSDVVDTDDLHVGKIGNIVLNKTTEIIYIDATMEANQQVTLTNTPNLSEHLFVYLNGIYVSMGVGEDYTVSGNILDFTQSNLLTNGDKLVVKYSY